MANLWHYFTAHWTNWVIPLVTWILGNVTGGIFVWLYPNRKAWREERKEKSEREVDSRVLEALGNFGLWRKGPRARTGAGIPGVKSDELAELLQLSQDAIADSLERLEAVGKAKRSSGSLDDPAPWWFIVPR
jgi:hypothetical protein